MLWTIIGPLLPESANAYQVGPVVTWILGAALGGALTGTRLRESLPNIGIRQIMLLAAASAGAAGLGWIVAATLESVGSQSGSDFTAQRAEALGLVVAGAIDGYAVADACGFPVAGRRRRPALIILAGWAIGLGLASYLGATFTNGLDLGDVRVAVTVSALIGLGAGLIGGAATFWQLARDR